MGAYPGNPNWGHGKISSFGFALEETELPTGNGMKKTGTWVPRLGPSLSRAPQGSKDAGHLHE